MAIIQWNIRSFRTHKHDLELISKERNYLIVALQESRCADIYEPKMAGFVSFNCAGPGATHHGGVTTLVNKSVPCQEVNLTTALQATAV